tara:strand:+ start:236 stop:448 length:213 start_codon:yes stop_codon:yes gene_type:complete
MAKSIQEMIEEAVKNMITDGRIVIQDDSGEVIEDLTVAIDGPEDDDDDDDQDDSESDEDSDEYENADSDE